ncbi:hypothetical protein MAR_035072 [Mya arenaria]|uniref:Uncharacterized protein n=1 Tax=Mya arenaria TaxID=6604 RepID=A0ABY7EMP2_MYAAR|nr:hypothetical protein MAR_035072 [Mya arenaria]
MEQAKKPIIKPPRSLVYLTVSVCVTNLCKIHEDVFGLHDAMCVVGGDVDKGCTSPRLFSKL